MLAIIVPKIKILFVDQLLCNACKLAYPVRDGIPVMLIDEALPLS